MKIKMNTSFAGAWSCNPGDIVDRPDAEARRLIEAGFAVAVREAAPVQTATRAPIFEKAIK